MLLVTGASGFIGTHLVESLVGRGCAIRVALRTGSAAANFPARVESVVTGDLKDPIDWRKALEGIDTVIHLAGRAHVLHETDSAGESLYYSVNVLGVRGLAEAAGRSGVRRIVFLSSSKVLGEETLPGQVWREDAPCAPQEAYGRSKLAAERELWEASQRTGLEVVVLRPPVVYGPGVGANILELFRLVNRGIPLPLGLIDNRRSLLFVGNLVDAIRLVAETAAASGETFHVSDGEDLSTAELVRAIAEALGRPARLLPVPAAVLRALGRAGDIWERATGIGLPVNTPNVMRLTGSLSLDCSKLRSKLNWRPPVPMAQGLAQTAGWYKEFQAGDPELFHGSRERGS